MVNETGKGGQRGASLSDRDEQIVRGYVIRRRTMRELAGEFELSLESVRKVISEWRAALAPPDVEGMRRELMELYVDTIRRTTEIEMMEGAPVTAGKDGDVVRDPVTNAVVRDYSGRLAAHKVRMESTDRIRKMLGLDAAERVEVTGAVRYELIGINTEDLK